MENRFNPGRRQILKSAIGGAAGFVLGAPVRHLTAAAQEGSAGAARTQRLSNDLFVVTIPGEANVVAKTGVDGVLLVDGGSANASGALLNAVAGLPGGGPVLGAMGMRE